MAAAVHQLRDKAGETEKITINLGYVDLGHIDLLVQDGFYSNRTDFIRTAIRTQLATQAVAIERTVARRTLVLGIQHFSRADLEQVRAAGETVRIRVLGLATIAESEVLGAFRASASVKAALASRIV